MRDSPEAYLRSRGVRWRRVGENEVRFPCPSCRADEGFSLNLLTGLWVCMRASCGERGNLYRLKVLRGDALHVERPRPDLTPPPPAKLPPPAQKPSVTRWHEALVSADEASAAREYLMSRGIRDDCWAFAKLGWMRHRRDGTEPDCQNGWIVIPYPYPEDRSRCGCVKLRAVPPEPMGKKGRRQRYDRLPGGRNLLYAPCGLDPKKTLVLAGGELDALSVVQTVLDAYPEGWNVVATGGEAAWDEEWADLLETCEDVVVAYDADRGGRKGAEKVANALGRHRCRVMEMPGGCNDLNDALSQGKLGFFDLQALITSAKSPVAQGLVKPTELQDDLIAGLFGSEVAAKGVSTGWRGLDGLVGGWRWSEMTLVTGETGSGKTTWLSQAVGYQVAAGHRCLLWPAEIGAMAQLRKLVSQKAGRNAAEMEPADVISTIREVNPFVWLVRKRGRVRPDVVRETLRYAAHMLGVRFLLLDHIDHVSGLGKDQWDRRSEMVEVLTDVADETGMHEFIVAHPDKSDSGNRMVMPWHLKGPSDLIQASHNGISLFRERSKKQLEKGGPAKSRLLVWKRRENWGRGEGYVDLDFDVKTERFAQGQGVL